MFSMHVGSEECGGHVVVELRGELDLLDAAGVAAALAAVAAREPRIIVDLAALEFIDASGITALSRGRRQARAAGGDLLLAAPQRRVRRVLAILWEDGGLGVHASLAAAASAGASRQPLVPIQPTKMRWRRISVNASAPRRRPVTDAWFLPGSLTRCHRAQTPGGISG